MPATRSAALRLLTGLIPVGVCVVWLPLRHEVPNTDLALVLVIVLAAVGAVGGHLPAVVGAIGAGLSFDLLHTPPYGRLAIRSGRDLLTTVLLVVAGLVTAELAIGLRAYRRSAESEADAFALVTDAAGLMATGGDGRLVVEALATELVEGLALADCSIETGPPRGDVPFIGRDGTIVSLDDSRAPVTGLLDLPIWSGGQIGAHFRLELRPGVTLNSAQCKLAVGLADQAGVALGATPAGPPEPKRRGLRLVKG